MKTVIIGITAAIGLFGGAASLIGDNKPEEVYTQAYIEPVSNERIEVYVEIRDNIEYINFIEPMEIKGYVIK